eukprot:653798_1
MAFEQGLNGQSPIMMGLLFSDAFLSCVSFEKNAESLQQKSNKTGINGYGINKPRDIQCNNRKVQLLWTIGKRKRHQVHLLVFKLFGSGNMGKSGARMVPK